MGLFDAIGKKLEQSKIDTQKAKTEAEHLNALQICEKMRGANLSKTAGYSNVLKSKCKELNNSDLERLFRMEYNRRRNSKAYITIFKELENRNLAYKDDKGNMHLY